MVVWSCLGATRLASLPCRSLAKHAKLNAVPRTGLTLIQVRTNKSPGGVFHIQASAFHWNKLKDLLNFYGILGLIPILSIVFYANVVIGPATLKPIPEGYVPKHWEYYSSPITRFIARYIVENPQKTYEKMCYAIFYWHERRLLRETEEKARALMSTRRDYQTWYYRPADVAHVRNVLKEITEREETGLEHQEFPYSPGAKLSAVVAGILHLIVFASSY